VEGVGPQDKEAWGSIWSSWYQRAPDTGTHSAAGWALRSWQVSVPEIGTSKEPVGDGDWYVNSVGMTMLKIPTGQFTRKEEGPDAVEQRVTLTRAFYLSAREVSRDLFQRFMNEKQTDEPRDWRLGSEEYSPTGDCPVNGVCWFDAVLFCNWLSRSDGLKACYTPTGEKEKHLGREYDVWRLDEEETGYRLPTEAEWEYACRAGSVDAHAFGGDESLLRKYAVFMASQTEPCGNKLPNGWGLFDMHGNVQEWCHDWYDVYGTASVVEDARGPEQGTSRVLRGGSFVNPSLHLRSAYRGNYMPDSRVNSFGFRPARTCP